MLELPPPHPPYARAPTAHSPASGPAVCAPPSGARTSHAVQVAPLACQRLPQPRPASSPQRRGVAHVTALRTLDRPAIACGSTLVSGRVIVAPNHPEQQPSRAKRPLLRGNMTVVARSTTELRPAASPSIQVEQIGQREQNSVSVTTLAGERVALERQHPELGQAP
eukprot:COSAG01_NODE_1117_length_11634_cov_26.813611_9_plen_166_part_00